MQVRIDEELCSGHGRCAALGPSVFELDELGFAANRGRGAFAVDQGCEAEARLGANACPERAIEILD